MTNVTTKEYIRKLLPKKSRRATPSNAILNAPKSVNQEDPLAQGKIAVENKEKKSQPKSQKSKSKLKLTNFLKQWARTLLKVQSQKERVKRKGEGIDI